MDEILAVYALAYLLKFDNITTDSTVCLEGFLAVQKFLDGKTDPAKHCLESFNSFMYQTKEEAETLANDINEIKAAVLNQKDTIDESFAEIKKEAAALTASHKENMENIEKAFKEGMKLRAPVEYWQDKYYSHNSAAKLWGPIAISLIILLLFFLSAKLSEFFKEPPTGTTHYWKFIAFMAIAALGIWVCRIFVRMFLSNLHMANDAKERSVMIETYLSLIEDGKIDEEKDRQLILQAIFRPGTTGIVKDDGVPHPVLSLLSRLN
jgi:hypothetical protein